MGLETASLFGGLAQGIFGRTREHEDEQRKLDLDERKTALTSLSSLLEHATPETRPTIYKQMSEVMKLKGKHRGVWDMLTGGGRDDYHNQLSTQLDGVFGNVVGPQAYEAATTAAPTSGNQADWGDESAGLTYTPPTGKIALRDPIAEHLTGLSAQYGLKNRLDMDKIAFQQEQMQERQLAVKAEADKFTRERDSYQAQRKAEQEVRALATTFALQGRQSNVPSDEEFSKAADQVAAKYGLKSDQLKANIGLTIARTGESEAKTQYYSNGTAGGGGRPETESQKKTFDANQRTQAQGTFDKWNKINSERAKIDLEQKGLRTQISNMAKAAGMEFDETNRKFVEKLPNGSYRDVDLDTVMVPGMSTKQIMAAVAKIAELQALKEGHFKEMGGYRDTLMGQFPGMYDSPNEYDIRVNPNVGGLAPSGAPRTGPPPEWKVPPAGSVPAASSLSGVQEYNVQATNSKGEPIPTSKVGDVIQTGKGSIRILGILGKKPDGTIRYKVEVVK